MAWEGTEKAQEGRGCGCERTEEGSGGSSLGPGQVCDASGGSLGPVPLCGQHCWGSLGDVWPDVLSVGTRGVQQQPEAVGLLGSPRQVLLKGPLSGTAWPPPAALSVLAGWEETGHTSRQWSRMSSKCRFVLRRKTKQEVEGLCRAAWTGKGCNEVTLELRPEGNREKEGRTPQKCSAFWGEGRASEDPGSGGCGGRARRLGW